MHLLKSCHLHEGDRATAKLLPICHKLVNQKNGVMSCGTQLLLHKDFY